MERSRFWWRQDVRSRVSRTGYPQPSRGMAAGVVTDGWKRWRWLAKHEASLPLAVFALTRLSYFVDVATADEVVSHLVVLDAKRYVSMAEGIAAGDLLAGSEPFGFAPLYGYVLAVFLALGLSHWALYGFQILCSGLTTFLVYRMGRDFGGTVAGSLAATCCALYGAAGMLELTLSPSPLATCLLVTAAYYSSRFGRGTRDESVLAGMALGAAVLASPHLLPCVLACYGVLAWQLWRARKAGEQSPWLQLGLHGVSCSAFIALATLRNWVVSGQWVLITSHSGITFYHGNNLRSVGSYATPPGFSGDPMVQLAEAARLASEHAGRALTLVEVDAYWWGAGWEFLLGDPLAALELWGRKAAMWFGSDEISMEFLLAGHRELFPSLWLMPLPFAVILGAAIVGLWDPALLWNVPVRGPRAQRRAVLARLGAAMIAANLVTALVFFFGSRYRVPVVPLLCVPAGLGLAQAVGCAVTKRRAVVASVLAAASIVSWSGVVETQRVAYSLLVGNEYFSRRQYGSAAQHFRAAVLRRPTAWRPRHNLGEAYGMMGRWRDALEEFEAAERLESGHVSTRKAFLHYRQELEQRASVPR